MKEKQGVYRNMKKVNLQSKGNKVMKQVEFVEKNKDGSKTVYPASVWTCTDEWGERIFSHQTEIILYEDTMRCGERGIGKDAVWYGEMKDKNDARSLGRLEDVFHESGEYREYTVVVGACQFEGRLFCTGAGNRIKFRPTHVRFNPFEGE